MYITIYNLMMVLSLLASLCVAILMWKRRHAPGGRTMVVMAVCTFVWTLGFLLESRSSTLEGQLFFNNVGYLGAMSVPLTWFVFAWRYTRGRSLAVWWEIPLLCIIPLTAVVLVWTNDWHRLMWANEHLITSGPFIVTAKTYGPFFWVQMTYNYVLIIAGSVILTRRLFVGPNLYRKQAVALMVAAALPLVGNIIYVLNLVPMPRKDLTPVMFAFSGIAIALGLMRFQLFKAVPFAHRFIVQQLTDAVMVFDNHDRLLEANPAALRIAGMDMCTVGKEMKDLSRLFPVLERVSSIRYGRGEFQSTVSGRESFFEMETLPMIRDQEQQVGWLAVVRDITERKKVEQALQESEAKANALIKHAPAAIFEIDYRGPSFVSVNDAVCKMSGYTREELFAMGPASFLTDDSRQVFAEMIRRQLAGENVAEEVELVTRKKDGSKITVVLNITSLPGKPQCFSC